jgi:hypothetical protein
MTDNSEPFGASALSKMLSGCLEEAKKSYEQFVNRLWAGNGAGAVVALTAINGGKTHDFKLLLALCAFVIGIVLLGIIAMCCLIWLDRVILNLESAESILDVRMDYIRRPSGYIGFTIFRTVMNVLSTLAFLIGTVLGLVVAWAVYGAADAPIPR